MSNGFDDIQKMLDDQLKKAESLNNSSVSFDELFTDQFMHDNTSINSLSDFFDALNIKSQEEFQDFPTDKLDTFVKKSTNFDSWEEMRQSAANEYVVNQLGF
ncbi:hypothetical protein ACEN4E_09420 [Latilactobacillus sakei]|uniref:hypothetical protein n=1 Tax=Latilactobacillus sakei TaxID=1599 RepID=UPI0038870493